MAFKQSAGPQKKMNELEKAISDAIAAAEAHANKHDLDFSIYPEYGMGGRYDGEIGKWYPSSESC